MAGNNYEGALKEVTRLIPMARGNWAPGCARQGRGKMPQESRGHFHGAVHTRPISDRSYFA